MKASVMREAGGPESLQYEDVETPEPTSEDVLVRIEAAGVNRMDAEMIKGEYGGFDLSEFTFGGDYFPHIMGVEGTGVVEETGDAVTEFRPGDRVVAVSHFTCGNCEFCHTGRENACANIEVLGIDTAGLGTYAEYIA